MNRLIVQERNGQVTVQWCPADRGPEPECASEPFTAPLPPEQREDLRWYLEDYLRAPYGAWDDRGKAIRAQLSQWGEALFNTLFGPGKPGRDAYRDAYRQRHDCEIVFRSNCPAFLGLPWELMKDPEIPTPLALDFAGFSRSQTVKTDPFLVPAAQTLRVLLVISRPHGDRDVSHQIIARPLMKRLKKVSGQVQLEVLRPPSFDHLRDRLMAAKQAGQPFHVVHFDGHGNFGVKAPHAPTSTHFDGGGPQGYLFFEADHQDDQAVAAADFAALLSQAQVPVVILNACRSATLADEAGPEAAVATRLLQGGVAAVVAMSHSVYAVAAAEFMATLYQTLFAGRPLAIALGD
ncbi:MAG: CHAT domain-containing protein, partial [Magnetospirillum sp.]|nr:CHAT domain-containing protein [Magnetospirillum sp.]